MWGHSYPCFGLLVMSPLGFKVRVGSLIRIWRWHSFAALVVEDDITGLMKPFSYCKDIGIICTFVIQKLYL